MSNLFDRYSKKENHGIPDDGFETAIRFKMTISADRELVEMRGGIDSYVRKIETERRSFESAFANVNRVSWIIGVLDFEKDTKVESVEEREDSILFNVNTRMRVFSDGSGIASRRFKRTIEKDERRLYDTLEEATRPSVGCVFDEENGHRSTIEFFQIERPDFRGIN